MAKYQNGKMLKGWKVKRSKEQKIKGQKVKIPKGKKFMEVYNHINKNAQRCIEAQAYKNKWYWNMYQYLLAVPRKNLVLVIIFKNMDKFSVSQNN